MLRIVFTEAPGAVAGIIRWITGSKVSHVGLQLAEGSFLAADQGGVKLTGLDEFLTGDRKIVASYQLVDELEQYLDRVKLLAFQGDGYDYDGLLWDMIPTLSWRWFKVRLGNPLAEKNEFWCSSFAVVALNAAMGAEHSIPELNGLEADTVTPGQLEDALAGGPSFRPIAL